MAEAEPYRLAPGGSRLPGRAGRAAHPRRLLRHRGASTPRRRRATPTPSAPVRPELGPYSAVDGFTGDVLALGPARGPRRPVARGAPRRPATRSRTSTSRPGVSTPTAVVPIQRGAAWRPTEDEVDVSGRSRHRSGAGAAARRARGPDPGHRARRRGRPPVRVWSRSARSGCRVWSRAAGWRSPTSARAAARQSRVPCRSRPSGLRGLRVRPARAIPDEERPGEEEVGDGPPVHDRPTLARIRVRGTVVARPTPATAALLAPLPGLVTVQASSVLADDPAVLRCSSPSTGQLRRPWLAQRGDHAATRCCSPGTSPARSRGSACGRHCCRPRDGPTTAILEGSLGQRREVDLGVRVVRLLRADHDPGGCWSASPWRNSPRVRRPCRSASESSVCAACTTSSTHPKLANPTGAMCGLGPRDRDRRGEVRPTRVTGTLDEVAFGMPMTWETCGGPLELAAGTHDLERRLDTTGSRRRASCWSRRRMRKRRPSPRIATRDVAVRTWSSTRRTVEVARWRRGGAAGVPENVNDGWQATLDGKRLEAGDRWTAGSRAGWFRPARAAWCDSTSLPDRSYRAGALLRGRRPGAAPAAGHRHRLAPGPPQAGIARAGAPRTRRSTDAGAGRPVGRASACAGQGRSSSAAWAWPPGAWIGAYPPAATARRWRAAGLVALATCAAGVAAALDRRRGVIEALDLAAAVAVGLLLMSLVERVAQGMNLNNLIAPWRSWCGLVAVLVVALDLLGHGILLSRGYFGQDDFLVLTDTRLEPDSASCSRQTTPTAWRPGASRSWPRSVGSRHHSSWGVGGGTGPGAAVRRQRSCCGRCC